VLGIVAETVDKASVIVPFTKFVPLIKEIGAIFDEIIDVVEAAEHNKRTCKLLENRVQAADLVVKKLRKDKEFNKEFFINKNFLYLQDLTDIIKRIKKFISEVSQMKSLVKYIRAKNIEKTFADLCKEFDSSFNLLSVSIDAKILEQLKSIDDNILKRSKSIEDELKDLRADQDEFAKVRLKLDSIII
jgi:Mg2+ and Co2+ transporter CorA